MSPKLPRMTGKEMIKFLETKGFSVIRIVGSHYRLRHPKGMYVTVPVHGKRILGIGLTLRILRDARISLDEYSEYFHRNK